MYGLQQSCTFPLYSYKNGTPKPPMIGSPESATKISRQIDSSEAFIATGALIDKIVERVENCQSCPRRENALLSPYHL